MEESDQEFSSSSSSDKAESSVSDEEENLAVMGEILAYQDELLATSDDGESNIEDEEDSDEHGLTSAMLLWRFENTDPVSTWWVHFFVVLFNLTYLKACLPHLFMHLRITVN